MTILFMDLQLLKFIFTWEANLQYLFKLQHSIRTSGNICPILPNPLMNTACFALSLMKKLVKK